MLTTYAVVTFAVAAAGGLVLAGSVLRGRFAPWALSLLHAALGAAGLVLVLLAVLRGGATPIKIALALLVLAALGGFYLAAQHLRRTIPAKGAVIVHASAAVAGFLVLVAAVLGAV